MALTTRKGGWEGGREGGRKEGGGGVGHARVLVLGPDPGRRGGREGRSKEEEGEGEKKEEEEEEEGEGEGRRPGWQAWARLRLTRQRVILCTWRAYQQGRLGIS